MLFKHLCKYNIGIRHSVFTWLKYDCKAKVCGGAWMQIKEVCRRFNVSRATLKYYEKEGLFEDVVRVNGIREYEDRDIERLSLIITLKNVGLTIDMIAKFIDCDEHNDETKTKRIKILQNERLKLLDDIHQQQKRLDSLDCLIYQIKGCCK